jgi:RNA polymerase sigma-70 factor (ECF subfamily)
LQCPAWHCFVPGSGNQGISLPDIATKIGAELRNQYILGYRPSNKSARWLTRNNQDAEDVVQEAYLRAFRFFSNFRGDDARAWLLKIVRNTCYTWLHVNRPLQDATVFDESLFPPDLRAPNPEEVALQNDSGALLRKALEKLSPNFREVLILRELEGMSYREIADITGVPTGAVMSSLWRARSRLRQVLTGLRNEDTA